MESRQGFSEKNKSRSVSVETVCDTRLEGLKLRFGELAFLNKIQKAQFINGQGAGIITLAYPAWGFIDDQEMHILIYYTFFQDIKLRACCLGEFKEFFFGSSVFDLLFGDRLSLESCLPVSGFVLSSGFFFPGSGFRLFPDTCFPVSGFIGALLSSGHKSQGFI